MSCTKGINIPSDNLTNKADRQRQPLYVILTEAICDYEKMNQYRSKHIDYLDELNKSKKLIAAGPTLNDTATHYQGAGMIVVQAESLLEAQNLANADPFHQHGLREYKIKPWLLSEGLLFECMLSHNVDGDIGE